MMRLEGVSRQARARAALAVSGLLLGSCGGSEGGTGPAPLRVAVVEVTGSGTVLAAGQTLQLTAVAKDSLNAVIAAAPITWTSSPASVASVSTTGLVRGVSAGSATVTASSGGKAATWEIAVRDTAALARTLSGRIERVDVTLTGDYAITGDLVLIADRLLRVNGNLRVRPGASVTLWSDSLLELSGTIAPDTLVAAAIRVRRLTSGPERSFHDDDNFEKLYIGLGGLYVTVIDEQLLGACPFALAGRLLGNPIHRIERSSILPAEGAPGTQAQPRGGNGCDVEIGTVRAQQLLSQQLGEPTGGVGILQMNETQIHAGAGGTGYTMQTADGRNLDNTWTGTAGSGGTGGHVRISAHTISIFGSSVTPGSGGGGGYLNVTLNDASGPNGEGQSLDGVTGSAGGSGDLELQATVATVERLREAIVEAPGGVLLSGGNGGPGAKGGELRMIIGSHSARGNITVPAGVTVEPSPANPGTFNTVNISGAANGGNATDPSQSGGAGGSIVVRGSDAAAASASVRTITLDNVSNGGTGYNGCVVRPKVDGTHGGPAGQLQRKQTPMTHSKSFNGGKGGDGHDDQGIGGAAGRDLENAGALLGAHGVGGVDCPDYLGMSTIPPGFTHTEGQTACPHPVVSPTLTNTSAVAVNYSATVSGTTSLTWTNASGTLQPGQVTTLTLLYTCVAAFSFNATLEVVAIPANGGPPQTIQAALTGQLAYLAVDLNHALGPYPVRSVIRLLLVTNRRVVSAHEPFCPYIHLHAQTAQGITIADPAGGLSGPYPDPEEGNCGYGPIITVQMPLPPAPRRAPP